jgi:voltage-gated potassium channel
MPLEHYEQLQKQLVGAILSLTAILLLGTIGYGMIEHWSLLDSAYMTVITLTTVGFSETHLLSPTGRLFTIFLIGIGVINIAFLLNRFTDAMIHDYFQTGIRLQRQQDLINRLSHHYIVCGFGHTGAQVALEFAAEKIPFVVIDRTQTVVNEAIRLGYLSLPGDATLDKILLAAGIERACCLVAALPSDAENLYILLSAKTLNPQIRTIARANSEEAIQKLQRAGADAVISPYVTGGKRMAAAALRPQVLNFLDGILSAEGRSFSLEELRVESEHCPYVNQTFEMAQLVSKSGALVVAICREEGRFIASPTGECQLFVGDTLLCLGTPEQLRQLRQLLALPTGL